MREASFSDRLYSAATSRTHRSTLLGATTIIWVIGIPEGHELGGSSVVWPSSDGFVKVKTKPPYSTVAYFLRFASDLKGGRTHAWLTSPMTSQLSKPQGGIAMKHAAQCLGRLIFAA